MNSRDGSWFTHRLTSAFESLPRRIFLDSCTAQALRRYGGHVHEGEPIDAGEALPGNHHRVVLKRYAPLGTIISAAAMGLPREECDAEIPLSKVVCGQAAVAAIV